MTAPQTQPKSPKSWKPKPTLRARIEKVLAGSGLTYSELCEIAITRALDEARGSRGLIEMKLKHRASQSKGVAA